MNPNSQVTSRYSSLLRYINSDQVNDLIFEEELKMDGYSFSYIVDPYDLGYYCLELVLLMEFVI